MNAFTQWRCVGVSHLVSVKNCFAPKLLHCSLLVLLPDCPLVSFFISFVGISKFHMANGKKNRICKRNANPSIVRAQKADFKINELVFAKMTGYPSWPGVISEIDRSIKVHFYGTNDRYKLQSTFLSTRN